MPGSLTAPRWTEMTLEERRVLFALLTVLPVALVAVEFLDAVAAQPARREVRAAARAHAVVAQPVFAERDLGWVEHHLGVGSKIRAGLKIDEVQPLRRNLDQALPIVRCVSFGRLRRCRKEQEPRGDTLPW